MDWCCDTRPRRTSMHCRPARAHFCHAHSGSPIAMRSPGAARKPRRCSSACFHCATTWACWPRSTIRASGACSATFPQALTHMALVNTARLLSMPAHEAQDASAQGERPTSASAQAAAAGGHDAAADDAMDPKRAKLPGEPPVGPVSAPVGPQIELRMLIDFGLSKFSCLQRKSAQNKPPFHHGDLIPCNTKCRVARWSSAACSLVR